MKAKVRWRGVGGRCLELVLSDTYCLKLGEQVTLYRTDEDPVAKALEEASKDLRDVLADCSRLSDGGSNAARLFFEANDQFAAYAPHKAAAGRMMFGYGDTELAAVLALRAKLEARQEPCPHEDAVWREGVCGDGWYADGPRHPHAGDPPRYFGRPGGDCNACGKPLPPKSEDEPCPHEGAKWDKRRRIWCWIRPEGCPCYMSAGDNCPDCNKPLPPKPVDAMSKEECAEELTMAVHVRGPRSWWYVARQQWAIQWRGSTEYSGFHNSQEAAWQAAVRKVRELREEAAGCQD